MSQVFPSDRRVNDRGGDVLIAGDVHLMPVVDAGLDRFRRFLVHAAHSARELYLLGDLFDFWTGPGSVCLAGYREAAEALRGAADRGLAMTWLPGNRDFNLDSATAQRCGLRVAGECVVADLPSGRTLLTHGDLFLTGDRAYQRMRVLLRSPAMRWLAHSLPAALSASLAVRLRRYSSRAVSRKDPSALRIVPAAVEALLGERARRAVCGHVHQATTLSLSGGCELWTLGAFAEGGWFLRDDGRALRHERFEG
ncbi:MAG: hypothetical protein AB1486_28630 [Planctomycetota bacterium]